jgi:hypothetical protein
VIDDLPCRSCGYNLRTLATSGVCPECATPIAASLRSERLREADPNWLRQMHTGCKLEYWGIWTAWISYITLQAFRFEPIRTLALPGALGVVALGTWMLASPDPSGIGEDRYGRLRIWARGLGTAQFATMLIFIFSGSASLGFHSLLQGLEMAARVAWGAILLWYLDRLAKRTWQSKIGIGFRINSVLFVGVSAVSLAAWTARSLGPGFKSPILSLLAVPFSWFNILFLYNAVGAFDKVLKTELAAANTPGMWRKAGSFLYSARQLFRRKNGSDQ